MNNLSEWKKISILTNKSYQLNEKLTNEKNAVELKNEFKNYLEYLLQKINKDNEFYTGKYSIGQGRKANSPWIEFWNKDFLHSSETIAVTFIFLPENNQVFITIDGRSQKLRRSIVDLNKAQNFYKSLFNKLNLTYNFNWKNSNINNELLIQNENKNSTTNSYFYTSIFYKLINLSNISEEDLDNLINSFFAIYKKVDLLSKTPWKIIDELNAYLK